MPTISTRIIKETKQLIEEDILNLCLSLSDDEEFKNEVRECSHRERVEQLEKNGFEIPDEAKTWKY